MCNLSYIHNRGHASFSRFRSDGEGYGSYGFYQVSTGLSGALCQVWFSHDLAIGSSLYIISECSDNLKDRLKSYALDEDAESLMAFGALDVLLVDETVQGWNHHADRARADLLPFEWSDSRKLTEPANMIQNIEQLHNLSQQLHIIYENFNDLEDLVSYISGVHNKCIRIKNRLQQSGGGDDHVVSGGSNNHIRSAESLAYLMSHIKNLKRWVGDYGERTKIRIDLIFNVSSRNDNLTNLRIADLTTKIAIETQRDSSSMITMAAVTMFFLPGTFVSAFFSMIFFEDGPSSLIASPHWWYYFAVTIPLTAAVFLIWVAWQRWRLSGQNAIVPTMSSSVKVKK